jgi:hypothetical protein
VVQTDFFIGQKDQFFSHYLKSFADKKVIHMHHTNVHEWLNRFPKVNIRPSEEKMEIAGLPCFKSIADFETDTIADVTLYSTTGIDIHDNNWWNRYAGVNGVLLEYEVDLYGKRMKVKAVEVVFEKQDPSKFERPGGYEEVNMDQMESALKELSSSFSEDQ